jgi:hypothetical protein
VRIAAVAGAAALPDRNSMRPTAKRTGSSDGSLAVTSTAVTAGRVCSTDAPRSAQYGSGSKADSGIT